MTTIEIKPPIGIKGWADFAGADTLSQLIWDGLSEAYGAWHYMNFTSDMSIWESRTHFINRVSANKTIWDAVQGVTCS